MWCRECQYNLCGLDEHVCPECGRVFDPDDPSTVDLHPDTKQGRVAKVVILAIVGVPAVIFTLIFGLAVIGGVLVEFADAPLPVLALIGLGVVGALGVVLGLLIRLARPD